jgi:hypothetical protein
MTAIRVQYRASRGKPQLSRPGGTRGLRHQYGGGSLVRGNDQAGLQVLVGDRAVHGRRRRDRRTENRDLDATLLRLTQVCCWPAASGASEPTSKETCHEPAGTSLVDISLEISSLLYRQGQLRQLGCSRPAAPLRWPVHRPRGSPSVRDVREWKSAPGCRYGSRYF